MTDRSTIMLPCQKASFGLPAGLHYLNCSFLAPHSDAVCAAGEGALQRLRVPSRISSRNFFDERDAIRRLFAKLIHATDATNYSSGVRRGFRPTVRH